MKNISLKIIVAFGAICLNSLTVNSQIVYSASANATLVLESTEGTNGCSVAWNSDKRVYYTTIAGNSSFPLEVFSETGTLLFNEELGFDSRGMWYNSETKRLEGNAYGELGIFEYTISNTGVPTKPMPIFAGADHQPAEQSVGALNSDKNLIVYYDNGMIYTYKRATGKKSKTIKLKGDNLNTSVYNAYSIIYTGRKNEEYGVLNFDTFSVDLYNSKGALTGIVVLPEDAILNEVFCFSYCNGQIWLFDVENRIWTSYKID